MRAALKQYCCCSCPFGQLQYLLAKTEWSFGSSIYDLWSFDSSIQEPRWVYILQRSFSGWQPLHLWDQNMGDGIGASIRFPYKTCYFRLKQIFVGLFVVLPEMNIRKVIKGFSGKHTEFLNHYWLMLFRKIPANCKDTVLRKDQVCSWDFSKQCLHSRSLK